MKKAGKVKLVFVALVLVFIISGTVFASMHGSFEGFSVVNVVVDGNNVRGDVPAINLNGRTIVPLRFVGEELGADISWNQETETAFVKSASNGAPTATADLDTIKLYNTIAFQYIRLHKLGNMLGDVSNHLNAASNEILMFGSTDALNQLERYLDDYIGIYNDVQNEVRDLVPIASSQGISIGDMHYILEDYSAGIDYYRSAYRHLRNFANTGCNDSFNNYIDSSSLAFSAVSSSSSESYSRYISFSSMIGNY